MTNSAFIENKTTCAYCGVGCGITARVDQKSREVTIQGDQDHPANFGRLCSKGSSLGETLSLETRLLSPYVNGKQADWETAIATVANQFNTIIAEHGPDAVAFYASGQLLTEDYYVANKLMKGFIGSGNIDTNSRLCMASAVVGHKRAFGSDTVPNCYEDLELADLLILIGSNTAWCHPVLFQRIRAAKERRPDLKIVVIDPRKTQTCDIADLHLPLAIGSDVALFNGLLAYLAQHQGINSDYVTAYTDGFDESLATAQQESGSIEAVAKQCQIAPELIETFYQWFLAQEKTVSLFSQGVNQSSSGTDKVNAIINGHLATGRIGKRGSGPFSITGQPNAMGGREVGGLANQLAAHMGFNPTDIDRVGRFWKTDTMAAQPGYRAVELFDAIYEGKVKAVWIMATNPVVSLPNADKVKEALKRCEFVVVSDCIEQTDTSQLADVKLPALGWSEKDGTVTNSERRISHQRGLLPAAGEAKPDWWIVSQVAQKMGFASAFDYQHPVEIFREHAALSGFENNATLGLRDFDISAFAEITEADYQALQPIQWPVNQQYPQGRSRFFSEGDFFTANRRGQFVPLTLRKPVNAIDTTTSKHPPKYPLILNTGRLRDQWHTMTRSALSPRLNQHRPEPFVEIHPTDAEQFQLSSGQIARLSSAWGEMVARVQVTTDQQRGSLFVPMHWTEQYAKQGRVGVLVNPVIDELSGQPESKHTPVAIQPMPAKWYGFILSRTPLTAFSESMDAAYNVMIRGDAYYRYELASETAVDDWDLRMASFVSAIENSHKPNKSQPDNLQVVESMQTENALSWQQYSDASASLYRAAAFRQDTLEAVICIAPSFDTLQLPERGWLCSLFSAESISDETRIALLSGLPTVGTEDTGATVCACFNVGEKTILKVATDNDLTTHQAVGKWCKAGTNCGSCIPEIKAILEGVAVEGS